MPTYPALPGRRMAYDEDGTLITEYLVVANTVSPKGYGTILNDESTSGYLNYANESLAANEVYHLGFWFPEARAVNYIFLAHLPYHSGTTTDPSTVASIDYTSTALSPTDAGWTNVSAAFPALSQVSPQYRQSANWFNVNIASCTAIRIIFAPGSSNFGTRGYYTYAVHLYGDRVNTTARLDFRDPSTDTALGGDYFNWNDVPQGDNQTKTFRLKNLSTTSNTAQTISLYTDTITDANPSQVARYGFTGGGGTAVTYRNQILTPTPLLYLPLDDPATDNAAGSTVNDSSGSTRNFTTVGTLSPGFNQTALINAEGTSLGFGGTGNLNYVNRAYDAVFDLGLGDFTLEFMYYNTTASTLNNVEIFGRTDASTDVITVLQTASNGNMQVILNGTTFTGNVKINDGVVHHITIKRASSLLSTFIDGVKDINNSSANVSLTAGTSPTWKIGRARAASGEYFNGRIGHFAFWNTALSDAQIERHYGMASVFSGTGSSTLWTLASLAASTLTSTITVRKQDQSNAGLGPWAARFNASALTWT